MKYVIEINDRPCTDPMCPPALYRARDFNTLVFDEVGLKKMKRLDDEMARELGEAREKAYTIGYERGYGVGHNEGYDEGRIVGDAESKNSTYKCWKCKHIGTDVKDFPCCCCERLVRDRYEKKG